MTAIAIDLDSVEETTDIVIEGHVLWVRPGRTGAGRYWQLLTPSDIRIGMVAEHVVTVHGRTMRIFDAVTDDAVEPATTAMRAARLLVASLGGAR